MVQMPKGYESESIEKKWYPYWMEKGYFKAEDESDKEPFSIVIPPPNVTGALHMGHALTFTIQDILIRWKRMQGYNTLWLPGTDHAGIATQMVVERELAKKGITRFDLGREKFLEEVWKWKDKYHKRITDQMKAMGVSVDWDRERFTLDEGLSRAVRRVFAELYKEGLIYRDLRLVNWSPKMQTVLSDLEVEQRETPGHLWYVAYPVEGSDERIVVATTRPETMLGDTGIMVHPDDERYKHLIGKYCILPLVGRRIPIVADESVDMEFGTGAVKVTPAHDFTDFEVGRRHNLEIINILNKDATLADTVPEKYRGLDRYKAREVIVEDLKEQGYLVKLEDYTVALGYSQRSGEVVEPMLSMQWFVRTKPLAEPAIEAVKKGDTVFIPKHWEKTYFHWMEDIRDWCISRQLWWGHRIPVWYCENEDCDYMYVDETPPPEGFKCPKCGGTHFKQDEDVLDTWFSSALWPFSTLGWPEKTKALETFYPTSVMETGFDIIFFWVARMMMMGIHFMKDVPFKTVYLHAMVRDEKGEKMSKVKGNVIDPVDVIKEYGADALRFTLAMMTAQGRDIKLSLKRVEGYHAFMNKIWNASRFVFMNLDENEKYTVSMEEIEKLDLEPADKWILTRLKKAVADTTKALEGFRFNEAANAVYQFTWHEFCDWYIELAKPRLRGDNPGVARNVLVAVMHQILKLLHPFTPFITEELWHLMQNYADLPEESVMVAPWPVAEQIPEYPEDERLIKALIEVISSIRNIKVEVGIKPSEKIDVILGIENNPEFVKFFQGAYDQITALTRIRAFIVLDEVKRPDYCAYSLTDSGVHVFIPLGKERVEQEIARLEKKIASTQKELDKVLKKLDNPSFVNKAPEAVVEKQYQIKEELETKIKALQDALNMLRQ